MTMYALVVNNTIEAVGRLPRGGDADGQWIEPLTDVNAHLAGWLPVVDTARPADTVDTTHDRSVELVAGTPTVVWTARVKSASELAAEADQAEREQVRNFVGNLDAYLALSPPSNAQVVAQVDRLTRAVRRLIKDQYGS